MLWNSTCSIQPRPQIATSNISLNKETFFFQQTKVKAKHCDILCTMSLLAECFDMWIWSHEFLQTGQYTFRLQTSRCICINSTRIWMEHRKMEMNVYFYKYSVWILQASAPLKNTISLLWLYFLSHLPASIVWQNLKHHPNIVPKSEHNIK